MELLLWVMSTFKYRYICMCVLNIYTYICICIYIYIHVHMYTYLWHLYVDVLINIKTNIYLVCVYVCVYVYMWGKPSWGYGVGIKEQKSSLVGEVTFPRSDSGGQESWRGVGWRIQLLITEGEAVPVHWVCTFKEGSHSYQELSLPNHTLASLSTEPSS